MKWAPDDATVGVLAKSASVHELVSPEKPQSVMIAWTPASETSVCSAESAVGSSRSLNPPTAQPFASASYELDMMSKVPVSGVSVTMRTSLPFWYTPNASPLVSLRAVTVEKPS